MEALVPRVVTTACVVSLFLVILLFPARAWLTTRYAPQARWTLWLGLSGVLILGIFFSGFAAIPQTQWEMPAYSVTIPAPDFPNLAPMGGSDNQTGEASPIPEPQPGGQLQPQSGFTGVEQTGESRKGVTVSTTWALGVVWLAGAAGVLIFQIVRYQMARRKLLRASYPTTAFDPIVAKAASGPVSVRILPGLDTPITLGVSRPVVLLPQEQVPPLALRHELTHIQRRDLAGKALLLATRALYWFDPLVWYLSRVADQDMEAACDGQMARSMTLEEKRAYGELLVMAAARESPVALSTRFGGGKEQLRARLTQLFRPGKASVALVCVLLGLAVVLSSLVAGTSATAYTPPAQPGTAEGETVPIDLAAVDVEPIGSPTQGVYQKFQLTYGEQSVAFEGNHWAWLDPPRVYGADLNGDSREELLVVLTADHGSGVLIEELHIFDPDSLAEIRPGDCYESMLSQVSFSSDGERFLIAMPEGQAAIPKEDFPQQGLSDSLWTGNYITFSVDQGRLICRVGCQPNLVDFCGDLTAEVTLDGEDYVFSNYQFEELSRE